MAWLLLMLCLVSSTTAWALISYVGADLPAGSSSSTVTFTRSAIPAVAGDVMLVIITAKQSSKSGARPITAPTGAGIWVSINLQDIGNADFRQQIFWKAIGVSDPASYTFTTGYSDQVSGAMAVFRGVDVISPIIASGGQQNASSTNITAPSLSSATVVANPYLVGFFGTENGNATISGPTPPMTNVGSTKSGAGPNGTASSIAYQALTSIGNPPATGTRTATASSAAINVGQSVALRPGRTFLVEAVGGGNIGTQIAGTDFAIRITAKNPDDTTDGTFNGTAIIASDGLLSAGSGVTANFVAGVLASHTVRVWNTGTFAITATQTVGSGVGTSNTFTVVPKLQILVPGETSVPVAFPGPPGTGKAGTPTSQAAGIAFNVTVNAVDEGWNLVTTATDTVTITSSDGSAVLPPPAALVSGTQVFSVALSTPSNQTLTATIAAPSRTVTSTSIPLGSAVAGGGFNACEVGGACTNTTPSTYIHTKLAGTSFSLNIVALKPDGTPDTSYNNTVSVELLNSSDNSGALDSDQCRSTWVLITTLSPDPSFTPADNGVITVGPFTLANAYRNARVRITNVGGASRRSCSSDNFSVRPTAFAVTSTNATNTGTSGTPAIKTGANFNLRAAAVVGYDGTPALDNTKILGTPTAGTVGGSFNAASILTGMASGDAFFYSEVGNIGLNANAVYDSSFTSVDQPDGCTADFSNSPVGGKYGCSFGSAAVPQTTGTSGFGRFIPDNFDVSYNAPSFATACGTFTYVGAPFVYGVQPVMTVTARTGTSNGLTNAATKNYAGAYMKLSNAAGMSLNKAPYDTQDGRYSRYDAGSTPVLDTAGLPATSGDPAIGSFGNGVGTLTFNSGSGLAFARNATTPNAPFDADTRLELNVIDTDLVAFSGNPASFGAATAGNGIAFSSGKVMRFGILKLDSAYGSELIPIRVPVKAMYWNGGGWQDNAQDNCTTIPAASLVFGNYKGALSSTSSPGSPTLSGGATLLTVSNPSAASGSVDLAINLGSPPPANSQDASCVSWSPAVADSTRADLAWLRGNWCGGSFNRDPNARLRFGASRSPFIFLREMY